MRLFVVTGQCIGDQLYITTHITGACIRDQLYNSADITANTRLQKDTEKVFKKV